MCPFSALTAMKVDYFHFFQKFADAIGLPFLETSAKSSLNVEQSFFALAAKLKDAVNEGLLKKQEQTHILTDVKSDGVGEDKSYFTCC